MATRSTRTVSRLTCSPPTARPNRCRRRAGHDHAGDHAAARGSRRRPVAPVEEAVGVRIVERLDADDFRPGDRPPIENSPLRGQREAGRSDRRSPGSNDGDVGAEQAGWPFLVTRPGQAARLLEVAVGIEVRRCRRCRRPSASRPAMLPAAKRDRKHHRLRREHRRPPPLASARFRRAQNGRVR